MIQCEDKPDRAKRNSEASFFLFALGGGAGLVSMTTTVVPFGSGFEMFALATNLAKHGSFANPLLALQTGPSAANPPLYPLLLALIIKVFRVPAFVALVATLGNVIANAVTAALLPRVSWLLYGESGPGIAAGVFWLLAAQLFPAWDVSYAVVVLLLFCLFSASTIGRNSVIGFGAIAGLLAAALMLTNPVTVLIFVPWLAHLAVFRRTSLKHATAYCCIAISTMCLAIFPWMLRNHREMGTFGIRTGFGLCIYVSNNECSSPSLVEDLQSGCAAKYQPNFNLKEAQNFRDLGEVNYDRRRLTTALAWIETHRSRFDRLTLARVFAFWFPRGVEHPFKTTVIWIFTIFSIPGLVLMAARRVQATLFMLVVSLIYPAAYYVILSDVRYRYPILWLSMLPAGYFLIWLNRLTQAKWQPSRMSGPPTI